MRGEDIFFLAVLGLIAGFIIQGIIRVIYNNHKCKRYARWELKHPSVKHLTLPDPPKGWYWFIADDYHTGYNRLRISNGRGSAYTSKEFLWVTKDNTPLPEEELFEMANDVLEEHYKKEKARSDRLQARQVWENRIAGLDPYPAYKPEARSKVSEPAPDPVDELKACKGSNANVCVAEGCYNQECVRFALADHAKQEILDRYEEVFIDDKVMLARIERERGKLG